MYETTVDNLDSLLKSLPTNTLTNPYDLTITEITKEQCGSSSSPGTIGYILCQNRDKYINLTFNSFPKDVTSAIQMFYNCSSLTSIDTSAFKNVINAGDMFDGCSSLTSIDTSAFTNVTDASFMFASCFYLTSIDTSGFTNVVNATYMFSGCPSLTSIDTSAFKNVTNASSMFASCLYLTSIDTSVFTNVTDASGMFYNCKRLRMISNFGFNLTVLIEYDDMFLNTNLTDIYANGEIPTPYDGSDFESECKSKIQNFIKNAGCVTNPSIHINIDYNVPLKTPCIYLNKLLTQLPENTLTNPYDITITEITKAQCSDSWTEDTVGYILRHNLKKYVGLNFTSLPTDLTEGIKMFYGCQSLASIDTSGFNNITNANYMFFGCISLTSIDTSVFNNVTNASEMFEDCTSLTSIDTSSFTNVTIATAMFANCSSLTSIDTSVFKNVTNAGGMLKGCTSLTSIDIAALKNVYDASAMFDGCSALKTITGWSFSKDCDVTSMLNNTPSDLKISVIHPDAKERNGFSFIKVHTTTGKKTVTYKSLSTPDAENITIDVPSAIGDKITFYNKNDEICVSSEITDETFNKMAEYRYPWNSSNGTLDPSKKNFVLWADSESNVVTNVGGGDTGIIPIKRGGTNAETELEASYNLFKDVPESTGSISDDTQFQFKYVTPSETNGSFYFRKASKVWEWIKGKADALYLGKTAKASSATTADSATNLKVSNHDTNNITYYPIWANGKGDGSTARGTYTSTDLNYVPATGNFKSKKFTVDKKVDLEWNSTTNSLDFKFL